MKTNNKLLPQFCCKIVVKNIMKVALFNLKLLKV